MIFRKFGGSYQFWVSTPEELPEVLKLDPALWAALSVPTSALNADPRFLSYLDADANGVIRLDDVTTAIKTVQELLRDLKLLSDSAPELEISSIRKDSAAGKAAAEFVGTNKELVKDGKVRLVDVVGKLDAVTSGALKGDGILRKAAVDGSGAEMLFAAVKAVSGDTEGITSAQLEKFVDDAEGFLQWAKETPRPTFRGVDPEPYYAALEAIRDKVDEFFRFCELIRLDSANARRFRLDPDNLPPLDLNDAEAVRNVLLSAPLAVPGEVAKLKLDGEINPGYRDEVRTFAELFAVDELTPESWAELQDKLAPYAEYLGKAQGDRICRLGEEKLTACLADGQPKALRELFARDSRVCGVIVQLKTLEKLILFKRYLWRFVNNFVCFKALFTAGETSMIQAGRLVMDGRTFALTLWIDDIAAHKAIAIKSHLCLMYLELKNNDGKKRYVATAITAGDLKRIYVGKPAFFIDSDGVQYNGRVVDLVSGPISFWQTVMAPFRRLGEIIGGKAQKLTDFSATEKAMGKEIDTAANRMSGQEKAPAKSGGMLGSGTMLLLAGGLSLAALGAAVSYMVKTIASIVSSLVAMPPLRLVMWIAIVVLILFAPLALYAIIQLRRRNLTLFLEAAGWAINLPMRLNAKVSRFFTFFGIYPENAHFKVLDLEMPDRKSERKRTGRKVRTVLLLILLIIIAAALWCWRLGVFRCCSKGSPYCRGQNRTVVNSLNAADK